MPRNTAIDQQQLPARVRAAAIHAVNRQAISSHFSALATAGMSAFVEQQPTVFRRRGGTRKEHFFDKPMYEKRRAIAGVTDDVYYLGGKPLSEFKLWVPGTEVAGMVGAATALPIPATLPVVALADIISAIEREVKYVHTAEWLVPPELLPWKKTVCQVQVMDAVRRNFAAGEGGVGLASVEAAEEYVARHCNRELFRSLWEFSDPGAESPMETLMRLLLKRRLNEMGFEYLTQVGISVEGKRVTTADALIVPAGEAVVLDGPTDFGWDRPYPNRWVWLRTGAAHRREEWTKRAVVLMFDGRHHDQARQREKDFAINAAITAGGLQ
ncbi:MAG TPA: hypothetical protein H9867_01720, partial [Candidatus Corynebacterium gallistercoris]|nr:hypothetical protein [Candidatus Corynebacterium gallistercoris]